MDAFNTWSFNMVWCWVRDIDIIVNNAELLLYINVQVTQVKDDSGCNVVFKVTFNAVMPQGAKVIKCVIVKNWRELTILSTMSRQEID